MMKRSLFVGGVLTTLTCFANARAEEQAPALVQLGLFGGVILPSEDHALLATTPQQPYGSVAPEIGARIAIVPVRYLGIEGEGMTAATETESGDGAGIHAFRAHLRPQLPLGRFTPFALLGLGALGGASNPMGTDLDPAVHFGAGAELALDDFIGVRLDVRDTMTQKNNADQGAQTHHPEVLLGLSFSLRGQDKAAEPPAPADGDGDGITDDKDACPAEAGKEPDGCPVKDSDQDGFFDDKDACPAERGGAPCGCPPRDRDGDKVIDELDACPAEAGPIEGCPDPDADRDGVTGAADKCADTQETKNGYDDGDGCPDDIPEKIKKFTGVVEGIEFDRARDTIRPASAPTLDAAVAVLKEFPALRILITGHTDADGDRAVNVDLSKRRADAVKAYFVSKEVADGRIETRGAGPDEPIADNKTHAGKQKNRRIEFKLLGEATAPPATPPATSQPAQPTEGQP